MLLALKLLLAPALVVASTMAGRRWGPTVAGTVIALPVVVGPILLIMTLEHGTEFGAAAARSSMPGLVATALYTLVYARLAQRLHWLPTLLLSWLVCLAADIPLSWLHVPAWVGMVMALVCTEITALLLPHEEHVPSTTPPPWWDLPARALVTAALVTAITSLAASLGPSMSGVLAPFPIATSVLSAFVHAQDGPVAVAHTLRGMLRALPGFVTFCFLVAILVEGWGITAAFVTATASAVVVQLVVQRWFADRWLPKPAGESG